MKRYFPLILLFAVSIIAIPAIPVYFADQADASPEVSQAQEQESEGEEPTEGNAEESAEVYKVLDVSTGEVLDVPAVDYVIGAVCAEMPATFEPEALKAQAVAAHTYAARQHIKESENPTPELCGADFSNDTSKYQGYFTINQAKQYFGENFDENYGKIKAAAEEVCRYIITYNDEPIISAFHSMSSGTTESAQNVWGSAIEYLVPVDSSYDTNAPKYLEETAYDKEILQAKLSEAFPGIQLEDDFTKWLALGKISDSGTVLELKAGDKTVT